METFRNIISSIGISDVLDILIVAFIFYKILGFIKETRAEQLAKGLLIFVLATVFSQVDKEEAKRIIGEFVRAIESMSASRTGALIVIERETQLNEIVETGTVIDAVISEQLIGNIFYEGSPLHDGALIVRGERLRAAGCVLPLTQNKELSKELGTRHRAGIGITENSDALVLIVSEETGVISIAQHGKLTRFLDIKTVEKTLLNIYFDKETSGTVKEKLSKALKGVKNAEE